MGRIITRATAIFLSIIFTSSLLSGQIGIGEWRTHLPYNKVIDVTIAGDVVFAATEYSLFTYNTTDNEIARFDKITGLSDVGISKIKYNPEQDALLVAYANTNIDIIRGDGSIINIPDIKDKDILGKKTINNVMFINELAYLSCGFGIVVLDMAKEEIHDTYYIGLNGNSIDVLSMTHNDTSLFAATESGIFYGDADAENLADYNQWNKIENLPHPNLSYNIIENIDGKLYANYWVSDEFGGDTMYVFDGNNWDYFDKENNDRHHQIMGYSGEIYVASRYYVTIHTPTGELVTKIWSINSENYRPLALAKNDDEFLWIGDESKGLIKNWGTFSGEFIKPNGPATTNVFDIDAAGGSVWVAPGGRQGTWAKLYINDGVFSFVDENWFTHYKTNTPAFDTISDMVCVKGDPANSNIVYVGTWGGGLIKFSNNQVETVFTDENSTLGRRLANPSQIFVSGLDYDDQHNLWVANSSATNLLSVLKNNGEWQSFNLGGSLTGTDIGKLMVDSYNQKWMNKRTEGFIIVYNDGNTIDDPTDDQIKILTSAAGNGGIPGSNVYAFATDLDGEVWVGSDKGISVFYSPGQIFEPGANYDAQQILVPRNDGSGLADILLETEVVTAIAVDGANRKWIGTERAGVFFLSEDGTEQLANFNTSNSPLLSNSISGITINSDGEVFFGTASGIISYRGRSTPPPTPGSNVYAYPNPVRENFNGLIAIKNVPSDASVKITDSYGNLVYETTSEGAQAVWDGYNFDGRRAATGVYLVFISNDDGTEKLMTKILVIR